VDKGERKGTAFETEALADFDGELEWEIATVKDGMRDVAFDTCSHHSPGRIYVPGRTLLEPKITVRGLRRWYCPSRIEFLNPKNGDTWRVGPYTLAVRWPAIRVTAESAVPETVLIKTLLPGDIRVPTNGDRITVTISSFGSVTPSESARSMTRIGVTEAARAWCGCKGDPAKLLRQPPKTSRGISVNPEKRPNDIGEVDWIRLTFHRPVEERFELTSPSIR
jgi:hypothetical protein